MLSLEFANRQLCHNSYTMHTFTNLLDSEFNNRNNLLFCFLYYIYQWKYIFIRQISDIGFSVDHFQTNLYKEMLRVWCVTGYNKHLTVFNFEIWWADCSTICKLSIHFYGNLIWNLYSRWYFEMLKIIYEQVLTTTAVAHTNFI